MKTKKTLRDLYKFPGFRARATLKPHPEDTEGYIVTLERRQKKTVCSGCGTTVSSYRDRRTHRVRDLDDGATRIYLEFEYRRVACPQCKAVKREALSMLAKSARFTQRFEDRIGQFCREMSIKRVAELNNLSWDQVCRMEKCYMRRLLAQHPPSGQLRTIGVDEISIHKGHTYAIVVADLDQRRRIWLGGQDMQLFFDTMGPERCKTIELAVMDMWKPFRKATLVMLPTHRLSMTSFTSCVIWQTPLIR